MTATTKSADLLIEGATVITMDAERRIFSDGAVAVAGGRITAVGQREEVAPTIQAARRIPGQGKVVIPGLINAHSHFFPFLSGAIPEEHPSDIVRRDYLYPFFRELSAEEEVAGAKARMWEMIRTGTTCFADGGCKHPGRVAEAVEEMGLRGVLGRWRCDRAENGDESREDYGVRSDTDRILEELEDDLRTLGRTSDRVRAAAALVDERVVSDELLPGAAELAGRYQTTLSVDVGVTKAAGGGEGGGNGTGRKKGLRPVQRLNGVDPVWWTPDDLGVKEVFTMPQTHPRYPMEFRCQMVELVRAGRTPEALAHEFEPSAQTIRTWAHQADVDEGRRKDGLTSDEREELRRLRRDNRQLRQEREILAKAAAWFARETDSIPSGSTGS